MGDWEQQRSSRSGRGGGRGRGSGGRSGGRGRSSGGGGGRGGGYSGGRSSGGRGSGGRGRGGRGPSLPTKVDKAVSNVIKATATERFSFYLYSFESNTDSRRRRLEMFDEGLGSKLNAQQKRKVFFEGSVAYSAIAIPGLEKSNLPKDLVKGGGGKGNKKSGKEVDEFLRVVNVRCLRPPPDLVLAKSQSGRGTAGMMKADSRCGDCDKVFPDAKALVGHCQSAGHEPVTQVPSDAESATHAELLAYCNVVLNRALGERMARWGRAYIDPKGYEEHEGVRIFKSYTGEFGLYQREKGKKGVTLGLTVDLRAKVQRTTSVLDMMYEDIKKRPDRNHKWTDQEMKQVDRTYKHENVIYTLDKRTFDIVRLRFDVSPATLPVEALNMSHAQYFAEKKKTKLKYPNATPMIEVMGRNKNPIFLPAELVCCNELDMKVRQKLPMIASFRPDVRDEAINKIQKFLIPGAQKTRGASSLLPAVGITLDDNRVQVPVQMLPFPVVMAAGMKIPEQSKLMWAPKMFHVDYKQSPNKAINLNVVVVTSKFVNDVDGMYRRIRDRVNGQNATYRMGNKPFVTITHQGNDNSHWRDVQKYFDGQKKLQNIFVLDLVKPKTALDHAYPVVKCILAKGGVVSQFINYKTCDHSYLRDDRARKKSDTILQGICRQILAKCGVRIWWVSIPKEVPLPAVFIGVDVFHSPRKFDPQSGKRVAKKSVAACIVQVIRSHDVGRRATDIEVYSQTQSREAGKEMELGEFIHEVVLNAVRTFKVDPKSCVMWRDGVGDTQIDQAAKDEIPMIKLALANRDLKSTVGVAKKSGSGKDVPLSYLICQKRINTKFITTDKQGLPPGSLVDSLQGEKYNTFYIHGTSPPFSTPKSVRFVTVRNDKGATASQVLPKLTWALCHDYPNWTGPVKLPSPTQMAHKLAELAGGFADCGDDTNAKAYAKKLYFF
mmetsp:Transcript_16083/g.23679  ORF Transcript_16083/g.23679 Transcript_16083/m.23679 type:complete len:944 (-) Transcript_16083:8-2839(-)